MPKAKQRLKNLDVEYISLVDAGANLKKLVYKASLSHSNTPGSGDTGPGDSFTRQVKIVKVDEEKHLVYCIVYAPDEVDAHGHTMEAAEIEKGAHAFMKAARTNQVDKQHNETPDQGYVAESWIVRKGDLLFDEIGAWAVAIKVLDEETWEQVKKGEITGISMQAWAIPEPVEEPEESEGVTKAVTDFFKKVLSSAGRDLQQKDFKGRLMERQIYMAVYAMEDEIRSVVDSDDYDTLDSMKGAINSVIEQFQEYVNNLSTDTQKAFKPTIMSKETTPETPTQSGNEPEETDLQKELKAVLSPVQKQINEKFEAIEKRLDSVEKAAPGSQSEKGDQSEEQVTKGYKGISFFGTGPSE